ncbi:hypothetical protein GW932_00295 [archaeon]|nr:hypothetical protein [archaeon]
MKFQFYYEKLVASDEFQNFKRENPGAYPCSGFFVLDKEKDGKENHINFDYYLPQYKKMFSFKVTGGPVEKIQIENVDPRVPEKLGMNYTFDLYEIEKKINAKMAEEKIKGNMQKILFSLQKLDGVDYLVITVFLSNMGLLKVHYDITEDKIVHFEKKSFLDMFKILKK